MTQATNLAALGSYITVNSSGQIGVGTTPTNNRLVISSANASDLITLGSATSAVLITNLNANYGIQVGSQSTGNGWLQVGRVDSTATAYSLLLQPAGGNVGINTTSPNQQLEVSGSTQSGIIYTRISNTYGSLTSNGAGTALQFYGWDAGITANIKSLRTGQPYSPSALTFETFGGQSTNNTNTLAERMRVDDYGNLCVGVTSYTGAISNTQVVSAGNFSTYKVSFGALAANTATTVTGITLGSYLLIITTVGTYHSRDTYILHVYDTADVGYANLLHTSYQITTTFSITSSSYNNYTLSVSFSNPVSGGSWNFIRIS
jgi:hypothetical protein